MKIRAFIALNPPAAWKEQLADFQRELKTELPGKAFRWIAPEQIHITLRFLGWISATDAEAVSARLGAIAAESRPFDLTIDHAGCFPSLQRARVIWVGLRGAEDRLRALHALVNERTAQFGEPPEKRDFTAHLTLARIKEASREELRPLATALKKSPPAAAGPWRVDEISLMQSHLAPTGARYEALSTHAIR